MSMRAHARPSIVSVPATPRRRCGVGKNEVERVVGQEQRQLRGAAGIPSANVARTCSSAKS